MTVFKWLMFSSYVKKKKIGSNTNFFTSLLVLLLGVQIFDSISSSSAIHLYMRVESFRSRPKVENVISIELCDIFSYEKNVEIFFPVFCVIRNLL